MIDGRYFDKLIEIFSGRSIESLVTFENEVFILFNVSSLIDPPNGKIISLIFSVIERLLDVERKHFWESNSYRKIDLQIGMEKISIIFGWSTSN
jgi:hypothetical protein